eukprot:Gb_28724 [translate_table: standard]
MRILVFVYLYLIVLDILAVHAHRLNQGKTLKWFLNSTNTTQWSSLPSASGAGNLEFNHEERSQENDLIKALPGQPTNVEFRQYSGYVTVDSSSGRGLFYYFVEATQDASTKPLLLWLNGGPGCSSLGVGAMQELGPFRVNPDGKTLSTNPYAWNQAANTLFLESPAGVGFSYSNTTADYNTCGDRRTGYYIPELADTIIKRNNGLRASFINFKGIMIGNGIMNDETDNIGRNDYVWAHGLISDETYDGLQKYCDYSTNAPESVQCQTIEETSYAEMGSIDFYNIYAPVCSDISSGKPKTMGYATLQSQNPVYDPCTGDYVYTYLNTPEVQRALHANVTDLAYPWTICSSLIRKWDDSPSTMFPIYHDLMAAGVQILIYSGDVDSIVPVTSTRYSIKALKLTIETSWYPWMSGDEVGGYAVIYKGLTFATVRGAGHEVPRFQPASALIMVKSFLAAKPLPAV